MAGSLTLLTLLIALHGPPVAAQAVCGLYSAMVIQLQRQYGETLRIRGTSGQAGMEMWANEQTGSWSIVVRYSNGMACLRAAGGNIKMFEVEMPGDDT